jgi:hypothetical protein
LHSCVGKVWRFCGGRWWEHVFAWGLLYINILFRFMFWFSDLSVAEIPIIWM